MCLSGYKFRSNSDLCLTGDLRQMPPGVIAYGIQFDLNLYLSGKMSPGSDSSNFTGSLGLHGFFNRGAPV